MVENFQSAVIIKAGICSASQQRKEEETRKEALNTVSDCDTAAAPTPRPRDKFAKCVSIKHDPAAHQLSLQDCIISAAGVDPVCQLLSVLPAGCGRGNVKTCLHRQIIAPRKRAICGVGGRSFHKQTPPGCQRRASVTCASQQMKVSPLSLLGAFVFCPATRAGGELSISAPTSQHFSPGANLSVTAPEVAEQVSSTNTLTLWVGR